MKVGVTRNTASEEKFAKYLGWLTSFDSGIEPIVLSMRDRPASAADECDGVMLTGGGDVDPALYGQARDHRKLDDVDRKRDEFEFDVLRRAFGRAIPVLGICRGLQVVNVYLGGTLHVDLESAGFRRHTPGEKTERRHRITVTPSSALAENAGVTEGEVNSYHHQAPDRPGKGLLVSARSDDGVIEGLEWEIPDHRSPLVLVQWHPERMEKEGNPLRDAAGRIFINALRGPQHHQQLHT